MMRDRRVEEETDLLEMLRHVGLCRDLDRGQEIQGSVIPVSRVSHANHASRSITLVLMDYHLRHYQMVLDLAKRKAPGRSFKM